MDIVTMENQWGEFLKSIVIVAVKLQGEGANINDLAEIREIDSMLWAVFDEIHETKEK